MDTYTFTLDKTIPTMFVKHTLSSWMFWGVTLLIMCVFASALGVVYTKAQNRILFGELQGLEKTRDALYIEWEQLLLEQNTWATQARIQYIAQQKLDMVMIKQNNIKIVKG